MSAAASFGARVLAAQAANASLLCVGLDPEPAKFPGAWRGDAARIFDFCAAVVAATRAHVCAYKPQIAHFAAHRAEDQLERLIAHIHATAPGIPVILDAKRGDIGSTAAHYAAEAFERYRADAVTLSPYLGLDSIEPYARYAGKGLILLCRTSNPGGDDLQAQPLQHGGLVYEHVARLAAGEWSARCGAAEIGLVVGATYPRELARVRELAPALPLLVPGVGAQGGDGPAVVQAAWRAGVPLIVSSSRAVLYPAPATASAAAGIPENWTDAVRHAAHAGAAALWAAVPGTAAPPGPKAPA